MKERKIIIILILIIIVVSLILVCKINSNKNTKDTKETINKSAYINEYKSTTNSVNNNNNNKQEIKTVYIVSHKLEKNTIKGIVKNNIGKTVKNLRITADCYDKNGNKLTNSATFLTELKNGETWSFEIWVYTNTYSYKNLKLEYNK